MAKGLSIKLKSYDKSIQKILSLINLDNELKKHDKIVLKPNLSNGDKEKSSKIDFVEQVLKFCVKNKNPGASIYIAEGCDGIKTEDVFEELGFTKLSEKYNVGLIDLNHAETEEIYNSEFQKFEEIHFPKILKESFLISLPELNSHDQIGISASLDNMLGAFPAKKYKGFFSLKKTKLSDISLKYQIHDILKCKMPDLAVIDAGKKGLLVAGKPIEMDKQVAKLYNLDWKSLPHLRLIDESFSEEE
jgi:uncharacterized protein (DUF362 family)